MTTTNAGPRSGRSLPGLLVLLIVASPTVANAQVSLGQSSASSSLTLVDETKVLTNSLDAFQTAAGNLLVSVSLEESQMQHAHRYVADTIRQFDRQARLLVNELKGDGVLTAGEVTEEFDDLRSEYLGRIEEALAAYSEALPPPPAREDFEHRRDYVKAMFNYTFRTRNSVTDWLLLAGGLLGGLMLSWLISKAMRAAGDRSGKRWRRWLAELSGALVGPLSLLVIALAIQLGFQWLWIPGMAGDFLNQLVSVLLIAATFWFLWNACEALALGLGWLLQTTFNAEADRHVELVLARALRIMVLVAFVLVIVNGVMDSNLTGLIAGLGVIGVILSFILRGTIENIAASFTIFGDKPFRVGDLIIFNDLWGRIEDIGFRSTRFRTLSGHLITIPNSKLIDDAIHNVGARPSIRRRFRIGLPYDTAPEKVDQAISILRELLDNHRGQPDDQPAKVAFENYGAYELTLLVQYYFQPADYWKALEFDSELNLDILRRFNDADIEFAFPTQSLYLHSAEDGPMLSEDPARAESGEPHPPRDALYGS